MKTLGICIGASSLKYVALTGEPLSFSISGTGIEPHDGDAFGAFGRLMATPLAQSVDRIAVTGRGYKDSCGLTAISEANALEHALAFVFSSGTVPRNLVSFGGETLLLYRLSSGGKIESIHSGNKCASGKGEFFLQQIRRMNLEPERAVELALNGAPYALASRCSVFCKSDCTHALNKGEPVENVVAGLCAMMAGSAVELMNGRTGESVALIGGVAANRAVCNLLKASCPGLIIPEHAILFEALGAAIWAGANECIPATTLDPGRMHGHRQGGASLEPLSPALDSVRFCRSEREDVRPGVDYVLGLDAGSTTTKAVLVNRETRRIAASIYLRTNGNPVEAARECYRALRGREGAVRARIVGLGTTGSGRHLTGLHADSTMVVDEILAHATAAVHFDPAVDTIFEIGGQDAKYTHLTAGVPSEYAMNEACSAGTGSFLEEAAGETMGVAMEDIAGLVFEAQSPENFSDQCAAFIGSDIKRAIQQGAGREDVLAGLVYSICLNYLNKVKGSRRTGSRVFMQGGVCYNKAVPAAMAALTHSTITVPPAPGLMGALGVALEIIHRLDNGLIEPGTFAIDDLIGRTAVREGTFVCAGGSEKCDRKCRIAKIRVGNTVRAFGGICNRYYNQRVHNQVDTGVLDYAAVRKSLLFERFAIVEPKAGPNHGTIGLVRSFLVHQLLPLYSRFFTELGFKPILSDAADTEGRGRVLSSFCFPGEISHGSFLHLIRSRPDRIFLPVVKHLPVPNSAVQGETCVLVQGESSYLKSTFRNELDESGIPVLSPVLWMQNGYHECKQALVDMVRNLGCSTNEASRAFRAALDSQAAFEQALLDSGRKVLDYVHEDPARIGIVLFGRPYNAFAPEADRGIAHKVASRGIAVIPLDMLDATDRPGQDTMFWGSGQKILKAAQMVNDDPQLFGFYITNYSCGPDSFLLGYFQSIMGDKPWLTLELDGHTADAGVDTRIDAALSIIERYRTLPGTAPARGPVYQAARIVAGSGGRRIIDSKGIEHDITAPSVELLLPSMGRRGTDALAAFFRSTGINARALPTPDRSVLNAGRRHSTCKECMPYHLTSGSFISYLENNREKDKVSLLFLPNAAGPCRLGQYCEAMRSVLDQERYPDTAVFTLTDEDSYSGMGTRALLKGWESVVLGDVFGDIAGMLRICAADAEAAQATFDSVWDECLDVIEGKSAISLDRFLPDAARRLAAIPLSRAPRSVPVVSLVGEIFVRREEFSRKNLVSWFEERGFFVKVAPVHEYFYYADFCIANNLGEVKVGFGQRLKRRLSVAVQNHVEKKIKRHLAGSGLYRFEMVDIGKTINHSLHLMPKEFRGEHLLTVGLGLREILTSSCGIISIGPFGCMPSRVAEAVLNTECNSDGLARIPGKPHGAWIGKLGSDHTLPFIAIEADGGEFPQLVEARLEAFVLQAIRTHEQMVTSV